MISLNQCSRRILELSGADTLATVTVDAAAGAESDEDEEDACEGADAWAAVEDDTAAVPLLTAASSAVSVFFPASPSCFRPERLWKTYTALRVWFPNIPSAFPDRYFRLMSACCRVLTREPRSPIRMVE